MTIAAACLSLVAARGHKNRDQNNPETGKISDWILLYFPLGVCRLM